MATSGKGCIATNGTVTYRFTSRTEAANWLITTNLETHATNTVAKKVGAAIRDGNNYCGYFWSADNTTPELSVRGHGLREMMDDDEYWDGHVERQPPIQFQQEDETALEERVAAENIQIAAKRALSFADSMGVYAALYAKLPQYKTIFDARKERGAVLPQANIYATDGTNTWAFNDLGELAYNLHINLRKDDIAAMLRGDLLRNTISVTFAADYINVVEDYYHDWE